MYASGAQRMLLWLESRRLVWKGNAHITEEKKVGFIMIIPVKHGNGSYNIYFEKGLLSKANEVLNLNRRVLVVTDSGVPEEYSKLVASLCKEAVVFKFEQGEKSKNLNTYESILKCLVENDFTRTDCIVAVGGGVVGDVAGFSAASYMRGIDFYNIPTTLLSQVDSSVGGKTAIDFLGYKNIVGAFYPPMGVLIDSDTLKTLPKRQISNGLVEALKMSMTNDEESFNIFENNDIVTFEDLLYGVILPSGADCVQAIEISLGGREKFVALMNNLAKKLNLKILLF